MSWDLGRRNETRARLSMFPRWFNSKPVDRTCCYRRSRSYAVMVLYTNADDKKARVIARHNICFPRSSPACIVVKDQVHRITDGQSSPGLSVPLWGPVISHPGREGVNLWVATQLTSLAPSLRVSSINKDINSRAFGLVSVKPSKP